MSNIKQLNKVLDALKVFYLKFISAKEELYNNPNFDYYTSFEELKSDITKVLEKFNFTGLNLVVEEVVEVVSDGIYSSDFSFTTKSYLVVFMVSPKQVSHHKLSIYVLPLFQSESHQSFVDNPYYNVTKSYINGDEFLDALKQGIEKLTNGSGYR